MKVLIISTTDSGGAANSCLRLHEGLLQEGVDSKVLLMRKIKKYPKTFQIKKPNRSRTTFQSIRQKIIQILRVFKIINRPLISKERHFLNTRQRELELFSFPSSEYDITDSPLYKEADIINLHWVAGFLDYKDFFEKNSKPVVWTLHDMNPFSGGEHYKELYLGIDSFGIPIDRVFTELEMKVFKDIISLKSRAIQGKSNLTIVAPSQWLAHEAKESDVFKSKPVYCIPYGVNSDIFNIRDKGYSRDVLNIPKDKKVILFVAEAITNSRKGYMYLRKALEKITQKDVVLCAVGNKRNTLELESNIIELGPITDELLMSIAYSAADVFIIPSLMDNLPNTVLESLMCGTPVIGFPVGGITDMIEHGKNGLLTDNISSQSLYKAISIFLSDEIVFEKNTIRSDAKEKYDLSIQAKKYITLYHDILLNERIS